MKASRLTVTSPEGGFARFKGSEGASLSSQHISNAPVCTLVPIEGWLDLQKALSSTCSSSRAVFALRIIYKVYLLGLVFMLDALPVLLKLHWFTLLVWLMIIQGGDRLLVWSLVFRFSL